MKALEFKGQVSADGKVTLPDEIRRMVPPGTTVRVLILIPEEAQEEAAWQRLTVEEFFRRIRGNRRRLRRIARG